MPSKCVLIATDFGSDSELIALRGVSLARALGAVPVLLHASAFPPPSPSSFYPEASRAIHAQAMLDLQRLASACAVRPDEAKLLVRSGHAGAVIRDTAHELGASLIVLGTRRPPTLERWLVGSVAESVARHAECPVLVIPCPAPGQRKAVAS
jgi:nucleotide-binding universal stress UspA family protein